MCFNLMKVLRNMEFFEDKNFATICNLKKYILKLYFIFKSENAL